MFCVILGVVESVLWAVAMAVSCMIWEKEDVKKVDLTVLELGWTIVQRVDSTPEVCDYLLVAVILAAAATLLPFAFRLHHARGQDAICQMLGNHWRLVTSDTLIFRHRCKAL